MICKIFGHSWLYPTNSEYTSSVRVCTRCGTTQSKWGSMCGTFWKDIPFNEFKGVFESQKQKTKEELEKGERRFLHSLVLAKAWLKTQSSNRRANNE